MRGKLVIVAIFLLAICMAGFAWLFNFNRSQHYLKFWGTERALAIRYPQKIEAAFLTGDDPPKFVDITKAPGISNAIHSLTKDSSYNLACDRGPIKPNWVAKVRFIRSPVTATVLFDFEKQVVGCEETGSYEFLHTKTSSGWKTYLEKHLKQEKSLGELRSINQK